MASVGHLAVGVVAARIYGPFAGDGPGMRKPFLIWCWLSFLPDFDVIAHAFGVRYSDQLGHRGWTHSLAFAALLAALAGGVAAWRKYPVVKTAGWTLVVVASHALLDMLTDGGLGCALFWPFTPERYFFGWTPIPVSPMGLGLFSTYGLRVIVTELLVFSPLLAYGLWPRRRKQASDSADGLGRLRDED